VDEQRGERAGEPVPARGEPVPAGGAPEPAAGEPVGGARRLVRAVEQLPDGRRVTWYRRRP
jgi:hypothetical protein